MSTIPFPNIAEQAGEVAQTPINALQEYQRVAQLKQATAESQAQQQAIQQQTQQRALTNPLDLQKQQLDLQQQQLDMQDQQRVRDAYRDSGGDLDQFQKKLVTAGVGPKAALGATTMINGMRQSVNNLGESDLKLVQAKHEQLAPMLDAIPQMPPEAQETGWNAMISDAAKRGLITPQEAQQHAQYPGPDGAKIYSNSLKTVDQLAKERTAQVEEQKAQAGDWKEGGAGTLINVNPKSPQFGKIVHGVGPVDQQEMQSYLTAPTVPGERLAPAQRTPASFVAWKAKQSPMAMVMGNQLPAGPQGNPALDQAAQRYSQTGDLPPGFARSPGTLTAIMNRAAQLNPDANIAGNKAVYGANKAALSQLQSQASKVNAFENTAGKNLDLFLQQADKVTDLGAKFADAPIRTIQRNVLGTGDMAAFDAARTTALTEIAKVLNSPTGAGVLSDSARHEAEGLIGPNATLNSIKRAATILRQDMKNRHDSYQQEIQNLQGTLGGRAQGSQQPNAGGQGSGEGQTATGPNGHKIVVRGGQWVDAQTGAPLR